ATGTKGEDRSALGLSLGSGGRAVSAEATGPGDEERHQDPGGQGAPEAHVDADVAEEEHQQPRRWERSHDDDGEQHDEKPDHLDLLRQDDSMVARREAPVREIRDPGGQPIRESAATAANSSARYTIEKRNRRI